MRGNRGITCLHHGFERAALVRRIALHGLHQIGDEIVPLLELDVDVGERLVDALPHGNEAVVDRDRPQDQGNQDTEDNPGGG